MRIQINGEDTPFTEFKHRHGGNLFLAIYRPLKSGDDVTYVGNLPEGVTDLWVRFPYKNWMGEVREGAVGNVRLGRNPTSEEQKPVNWEKIFNEFG